MFTDVKKKFDVMILTQVVIGILDLSSVKYGTFLFQKKAMLETRSRIIPAVLV